ncbi:hypothetical protein B0H11DRAFT_2345095 [Mycena galericulata]|nr:hypothetical protein B0H11DRAFT_2345095 [Mycena galericulata]
MARGIRETTGIEEMGGGLWWELGESKEWRDRETNILFLNNIPSRRTFRPIQVNWGQGMNSKTRSRQNVRLNFLSVMECSVEFYGLADDGWPCNKCTMLATITSDVEKTVIREKAQCQSCSLVYGQLHLPLCHSCCGSYVRADSIPAQISLLPGAIDQILSQKSSESTSDIWGLVKGHKQNVSQHHLGVPRAQNPSLLKATAFRLKGTAGIGTGITSKGQQYLQDMKDKCEQGKKVKFTISMAKSVAKKPGIVSFILIPEIRFVELVNEEEMGYDVLDSIVLKAQEYHTESYPLSGKIYRNIVTFYAFVTATNIFRIPASSSATTIGSAMDLVHHFKTQNYITQGQFETKTLQLRLIVNQYDLASLNFFICGFKLEVTHFNQDNGEIFALALQYDQQGFP